MPVLYSSRDRAIPAPPESIFATLPKAARDAFAERDRLRALLDAARRDAEEVARLHEAAITADRNAEADVRLRQTGEKYEATAPALADRLVELSEEGEVLALAVSKAEDTLAETLIANTEKINAGGRKALREALANADKLLNATVDAFGDVEDALGLIRYSCEVADGRVPLVRRGRIVTGVEKRNGDSLTTDEALRAAHTRIAELREAWTEAE